MADTLISNLKTIHFKLGVLKYSAQETQWVNHHGISYRIILPLSLMTNLWKVIICKTHCDLLWYFSMILLMYSFTEAICARENPIFGLKQIVIFEYILHLQKYSLHPLALQSWTC